MTNFSTAKIQLYSNEQSEFFEFTSINLRLYVGYSKKKYTVTQWYSYEKMNQI